jgi:hypothetical protein
MKLRTRPACAKYRGIERALVEHFIEHRDEIEDALERIGWLAANQSAKRAGKRLAVAYVAVMAAPVTGLPMCWPNAGAPP